MIFYVMLLENYFFLLQLSVTKNCENNEVNRFSGCAGHFLFFQFCFYTFCRRRGWLSIHLLLFLPQKLCLVSSWGVYTSAQDFGKSNMSIFCDLAALYLKMQTLNTFWLNLTLSDIKQPVYVEYTWLLCSLTAFSTSNSGRPKKSLKSLISDKGPDIYVLFFLLFWSHNNAEHSQEYKINKSEIYSQVIFLGANSFLYHSSDKVKRFIWKSCAI